MRRGHGCSHTASRLHNGGAGGWSVPRVVGWTTGCSEKEAANVGRSPFVNAISNGGEGRVTFPFLNGVRKVGKGKDFYCWVKKGGVWMGLLRW
ncbi:hypothetical protein S83_056060 [Arachis hypogaea]